jgi:hypothetical protein
MVGEDAEDVEDALLAMLAACVPTPYRPGTLTGRRAGRRTPTPPAGNLLETQGGSK